MINALFLCFLYLLGACVSPPDGNISSAQTLLTQGRFASENKHYQQALDLFQSARETSSTVAHLAHFESGNIYARLGQPDLASQEYEFALAVDPNHAESRHNLAVLRADQGRLPEAVTLLESMSEYVPALATLAVFSTKQGDYQKATDALQRALSIEPTSADLHRDLGSLYMKQGLYEKATDVLETAWNIDSTHAETARLLGLLNEHKGMPSAAVGFLRRALALRPTHTETHYNLATALAKAGRRKEANAYMQRFEELAERGAYIAQLRRSLDDAPNDIGLHTELANHYTALGEKQRAHSHYQAILLVDSLHLETIVRFSTFLLKEQDLAQSLSLCERGIRTFPKDVQVAQLHSTAGYIHLLRAEYERAEDHFTRSLRLDKKQPHVWNNLGNLQQRRGDLSNAEDSFEQSIATDALFADAHFNLALIYQRKKAWPSALKSFRTVLQLDPQYARGYLGLATVYESVDSTHLAIDAYRQFLDQTEEDTQGRTHAEQRIAHLESKY